jgi:hypothetical protein
LRSRALGSPGLSKTHDDDERRDRFPEGPPRADQPTRGRETGSQHVVGGRRGAGVRS